MPALSSEKLTSLNPWLVQAGSHAEIKAAEELISWGPTKGVSFPENIIVIECLKEDFL